MGASFLWKALYSCATINQITQVSLIYVRRLMNRYRLLTSDCCNCGMTWSRPLKPRCSHYWCGEVRIRYQPAVVHEYNEWYATYDVVWWRYCTRCMSCRRIPGWKDEVIQLYQLYVRFLMYVDVGGSPTESIQFANDDLPWSSKLYINFSAFSETIVIFSNELFVFFHMARLDLVFWVRLKGIGVCRRVFKCQLCELRARADEDWGSHWDST